MTPASPVPVAWLALFLLPIAGVALTAFARFSILLSVVRVCTGPTLSPPPTVMHAAAAVLTLLAMSPLIDGLAPALEPLLAGDGDPLAFARQLGETWKAFLLLNAGPEELQTLAISRPAPPGEPPSFPVAAAAFVLTELRLALVAGLVLCLPFLAIDVLAAATVDGTGLSSLPAASVASPAKVAVFLAADGWLLLTGGVLETYRFP